MSNVARVAGQAANILVKPLNVEDVFSTYLYTGNESTQTITNGIDLDGEGGLVWIKRRNSAERHALIDDRDLNSVLASNENSNARTRTGWMDSFNSDGFTLNTGDTELNNSGDTYASWTFRKAPKFFDVVTYTGNGSTQTISHNLGSVPGTVIVKKTNSSANWIVYHRSLGNDKAVFLNLTSSQSSSTTYWNATTPTSSVFSVGANSNTNGNGDTFVAYLFAHNDDDGEFGPDGDADIIKCGSYSGQATVDLGFEPQWLLVKQTGATSSWRLVDNMRGWGMGDADLFLAPDRSDAELTSQNWIDITPTGFKVTNSNANVAGTSMIYIAIRRGPMAVPEDADDVFAIDTRSDATSNPPSYSANGIVDMALQKELNASGWGLWDRMRGQYRLKTHATDAEDGPFSYANFDHMDGWADIGSTDTTHSWMWRRAPNYFDVVAYTGDGATNHTVSHNLGVAPEMMWIKDRDDAEDWSVYHAGITNPEQNYLYLNSNSDLNPNSNTIRYWNHTAPTDSVFTLGDEGRVNQSGENYIAYLFASLDGISKVGSYTGNGSTQTIDCGFTSGARFILIKRTDSTGSWCVFDSERGIVAGNDSVLYLQLTNAEVTTIDWIDPNNSGFEIVTSQANINASGGSYIFYAIA